jgi:hypothetical protein
VKLFVLSLSLLAASGFGLAQSPDTMTDQRVVNLVGSKTLSESEIIQLIRFASDAHFDLSPSATDQMVRHGVSQSIMKAMAERSLAGSPNPPEAPVALVTANNRISTSLRAESSATPAGSRVFITRMPGGLDGFIAAEIIKQKLPMVVVTDESDASYILVGESLRGDDHWYNAVWGGKDKNEGNMRLLSVREKRMVWAGEAGDRHLFWSGIRRGGQRKVASRIVKNLRNDLFRSSAM